MILMDNIIYDGHPTLRLKAKEVEVPIKMDTINTLKEMCEFLKNSQDPEISEKYQLRAGVGLAAPQINVSLRMFSILCVDDDGVELNFGIINPKILAESTQMTYLSGGEGCLSVKETTGNVLRHKKIKVSGIFYDPINGTLTEKKVTFTGYPAIVFQHEFDHLNGVLFTDKITNNILGVTPTM